MLGTMSIKKQKHIKQQKIITVEHLKRQKANYDIGFWKIPRTIHGERYNFLIVRTDVGEYILTTANLQPSIISCATLDSAVKLLNKYVHDANSHDIALLSIRSFR